MCWFVFETVSSPLVFCHCDSDRWLESQRCGVLSARGWCFWMLGSNSHSKSTIVWLVVSFIFYVPFHIWDVILPIDELIFFKMVIAPPTSCDRQVLLEMMRFPHPPNIFENCWFFLWIFVWKPWASEVFPVQTYLMAFDGPWWYLSCVAHHGVCLRFLCMCPDGYMNQKKLSRFFKKMCLFLIHHIHHIYISYIIYIIYIYYMLHVSRCFFQRQIPEFGPWTSSRCWPLVAQVRLLGRGERGRKTPDLDLRRPRYPGYPRVPWVTQLRVAGGGEWYHG